MFEMHAEIHAGLHETVCYCCLILTKIRICRQVLERPHVRYHENPFSCSQVVTCEQRDRQTG